MIWWALQPGRARAERAAIAELEGTSAWLSGVEWKFGTSVDLVGEFDITIDDATLRFSITYPEFFPASPPSVRPLEAIRISGHQYGAGGELCLEWRADNWSPEVTGSMMIESAYRLLAGENEEDAEPVPSAHRTTLGQDVRGATVRLIVTPTAASFIETLPINEVMPALLKEHKHAGAWIATLVAIGEPDNPIWSEAPPYDLDTTEEAAVLLRLPAGQRLPKKLTPEALDKVLRDAGQATWATEMAEKAIAYVLLVTDAGMRLTCHFGLGEKRKSLDYTTIAMPPASNRLGDEFAQLQSKCVAIVGCGSVGSKIAASLTRSGVRSFLLIDGDILLPENLVRHDLDQRASGLDKAEAVRTRIREIDGACKVNIRTLLFGGQESASATNGVMTALAKCDLIVDATAAPEVFNLCAAVSQAEKKAMVWGVVYGGGIGGLIARVRPDIDPPAIVARNQIARWYAERGSTWSLSEARGYDGVTMEGAPLIASDADVSVIAAHLTRLALDTLIAPEPSEFPNSAYAIGLSAKWIFSAPFDTWPIGFFPEGSWGPVVEPNLNEDLNALMSELFPKAQDGEA